MSDEPKAPESAPATPPPADAAPPEPSTAEPKAAPAQPVEPKPVAAKPADAKPKHAESADKPVWERDPVPPAWVDLPEETVGDGALDPHRALVVALRAALPEAILAARTFAGDLALDVARERIVDVSRALKETHGYALMVDVCGVDWKDRAPRFEVVYHLGGIEPERRVRLRVQTDEATPVPSIASVYRGAAWPEREVYDMFGIRFSDHPDLTRILLWEGFNGYPLRKEFPVEGIDTGAAIYPERYGETAGPVAGAGTGWQPKKAEADKPAGGSGGAA